MVKNDVTKIFNKSANLVTLTMALMLLNLLGRD